MPYVPEESFATLKHFYFNYGSQLWGEFGFRDAFNLDQDWFAKIYVAIDQGPIIIMIENYRSQLCWDMFMKNSEIPLMLENIGWTTTNVKNKSNQIIRNFKLHQNYPNPFNAQTVIRFSLPEDSQVTLEIYNVLGEKVASIYSKQKFNAGNHQVRFNAENLPSGVYFYRMEADDFKEIRKMLLVR